MTGAAALRRLARRDARRHPLRSALLVALVALPTVALVATTVVWATSRVDAADRAAAAMGAADVMLLPRDVGAEAVLDDRARAVLGVDAVVEGVAQRVTTVGDVDDVLLWLVDGELARPAVRLTHGRWPTAPDEVAVPAGSGAAPGDVVDVAGRPHTVVGEVRHPVDPDLQVAVATLGATPPTALLVDLPDGRDLGLADTTALGAIGWHASLASAVPADSGEAAVGLVLLGGTALLVVVLLGSAAFAVVGEQRRHDLGLLRAVGASDAQLRRAVTASGWVVGLLGGVGGAALGVVVPALVPGLLERVGNRVVTAVEIPWAAVAATAALATTSAVLAARGPARGVAAATVRGALAGGAAQRPWRRPPLRHLALTALGVAALGVVVAAGSGGTRPTTVAAAALAALVVTVLGVGPSVTWAVGALSQTIAWRLPVAVRIGVRDLVRTPGRTAPLVTALVALLSLDLLVAGFLATAVAADRSAPPRLGPDALFVDGVTPAVALPGLHERLPVRRTASLRLVVALAAPGAAAVAPEVLPTVAVADPDLLAALGADAATLRAAADGATVVLRERGQPAPAVPPPLAAGGVHEVVVDERPRDVPELLVPPSTLTGEGLVVLRELPRLLVQLDRPVTPADLEVAAAVAGPTGHRVQGAHPPPTVDVAGLQRAATVVTGLVVLVITVTGLALLSVESAGTERVMVAVGAPPVLRRRLSALRGVLLSALAGLVAVPVGAAPLWAIGRADAASALAGAGGLPTGAVAGVLVGLPLAAAAVGWLLPSGRTTAWRAGA